MKENEYLVINNAVTTKDYILNFELILNEFLNIIGENILTPQEVMEKIINEQISFFENTNIFTKLKGKLVVRYIFKINATDINEEEKIIYAIRIKKDLFTFLEQSAKELNFISYPAEQN